MIRITLKGVRGHVLRFVLTVASVTLGTALVAGTYVLTDSINKTFDQIFDSGTEGVDVVVRGLKAGKISNEEGWSAREQLPIGLADTLREVPGVARVSPDLSGSIVLVGKDGTAVRNGGAPTLGYAAFADDPALDLVAGRLPVGGNEVAVETSTLELAGLQVGDRTRALIGGEPTDVTVTGEVKFGAPMAGATLVLVDEQVAQAVFAPDGKVTSFSVGAQDGVTQTVLRDRIAPLLPARAEALTAAASNEEDKKDLHEQLGFINIFLLVFAGVSVFVGAFIIANTFSMLVSQRTRELALLRAVGASRAQVLAMVLGEATVVGLAGGLVGLGAGIGLAVGLQQVFLSFGLEISGGLPVLPRTVVVTLAVGVLVTFVSALHPAIRASRVAPMAALRDDLVRPAKGVRRLGTVGLAMLVAGVATVIPVARQDDVNWWAFLGTVVLLVVGTLLVAPLLARPVIRFVTWPFVLTLGVVGRLARENGLRVPRRTAITASALMIGVALMAGTSVIAQSMKASVSDIVDEQLTADYVLNGGMQPFPGTVVDEARALPGVRSVAGVKGVPVQVGSSTVPAVASDAQSTGDNLKVRMREGTLDVLDRGQVVVDGKVAESHHWSVGSTVTATIGSLRDHTITVGAIVEPNQLNLLQAEMLIPHSLYTEAVPAGLRGEYLAFVKVAPEADREKVRAELSAAVKPYLVVSVQDAGEFTDDQASQINTMLTIMFVLLALSVVIAVLGIINTLALSVFERTREMGLLRAVGLSRGQLSRTITIEAVSTAVLGALLGAALGLGLGVALRRGLASQGLETLAIPWGMLIALVIAAAVAGVVAAVLPAIRAVRLDVLRAITTE